MKLQHLQAKLLAAARSTPADARVPYAFEQRIMARLTAAATTDLWTAWGRAFWRAALPCLAIMLLATVWAFWSTQENLSSSDFSQEFETAVFAMADHPDDAE
jgi:hypothetical protein